MPTQNVMQWFENIFCSEAPTHFIEAFENASVENKTQLKHMVDGQGKGLFEQAIISGRPQWVKWFLTNDWPMGQMSVAHALVLGQKLHSSGIFRHPPLHLSDLMDMMSTAQWSHTCQQLSSESASNLIAVLENQSAPLFHSQCTRMLQSLSDAPQKHEIFKHHCLSATVKALHNNMYYHWFDDFHNIGWDVKEFVKPWNGSLNNAIEALLNVPSSACMHLDKNLNSEWFKHLLIFSPDTNEPQMWHTLICAEGTNGRSVVERVLQEGVDLSCEQVSALNSKVAAQEHTHGASPALEVLGAFLNKQIITASLKNSVNSEISSSKKPFKKM